MNILITGGAGLLGQYLNISLNNEFNILSLYHKNKGNTVQYNSAYAEIRDYSQMKQIFNNFKPDIVIHTAAIPNPERAMAITSKEVYDINVNATKNIAELCESSGCKLIYNSTDLVYAGYRGSLLDENSKLIPVSLYAETKLMGEIKISETFENYIILRTALLFGIGLNHSQNFFSKSINELKNNRSINVFTDQHRSPLSLHEAANIIKQILKKDFTGIYNFGSNERMTRYELFEKICSIYGFDKNLINKITMDDVPDYPNVDDVSMNVSKLMKAGISIKSVDEQIKDIMAGQK